MTNPEKKENEENPEDPLSPTPVEETSTEQEGDTGAGTSGNPEIDTLQAELSATKDKMMRALADAENTRKRALKEREDVGKYAIASFARDLLGFTDNFDRALQAIPEEIKSQEDSGMKNVFDGIEAMQREILGVLERHGVKKIEPLGEAFNPNFHEVMFEAPSPEHPAGIIMQVIEPGYVLHDRLLRAAKVGVSKGADGEPPPRVDTKA